MKPTNEERREMAARLRELAAGNQGLLEPKRMGEVLAEAQKAMGTRGLASVAHVLERYADLIEPEERTCRAEKRYYDDGGSPWPYYVCSECGESLHYRDIVTEYGEESCEMLPYCASCGAKAVGE